MKEEEFEEQLLIRPERNENSSDYLPPEHIRMADRKDHLLALLADEDAIWHEPSRRTVSVVRRLLRR